MWHLSHPPSVVAAVILLTLSATGVACGASAPSAPKPTQLAAPATTAPAKSASAPTAVPTIETLAGVGEPTQAQPQEPAATPETPAPLSEGPVAPKGQLEVHIIDVGQGDSIFIRGPEGQTMLIDGGSEGTGALQYLQGQGVDHLDLMLATHPHEDHIGGLPAILKEMPVGRVVMNGQPTTTRIYERLLDTIAAAKAEYQEVKRGDKIQLGSLTFDVLHPTVPTGPNLNNQSIVLRLVWGQASFILPGDAERETEADILASRQPVAATILKVGHHGSRTATSPAWLKAISPTVAIYSAGQGNSPDCLPTHPSQFLALRVRQMHENHPWHLQPHRLAGSVPNLWIHA